MQKILTALLSIHIHNLELSKIKEEKKFSNDNQLFKSDTTRISEMLGCFFIFFNKIKTKRL